jgi:hypothetical protein
MSIDYLIIIFAISFATNSTPFFGTPYTLVATSFLIKSGITPVNMIEVILITAIGAASAKSVMYSLGFGVRSTFKRNKNVKFFSKFINKRSFFVMLFFTALFPFLPLDDFIFLIGGAGRASLLKMLEITFVSKIIKSSIEISIEAFGLIQISNLIGISPFLLGIISSIVFTILGIVIFKIDWETIYTKLKDKFGFSYTS